MSYNIVNYLNQYGDIIHFKNNKNTYIHGWYPFVEGYCSEFICKIVAEYSETYGRLPGLCLDPFCGSGTTPLELQKMGIKCMSFEVSPFMYNLSRAKMNINYSIESYKVNLKELCLNLKNSYKHNLDDKFSDFSTLVEKEGMKKWNFNKCIMEGILDVQSSIELLKDQNYKELFSIALASILLDVSNVYRKGKCISYKKNWNNTIKYTREDVHKIFLQRLEKGISLDIEKLEMYKAEKQLLSNRDFCFWGDCRKLVDKVIKNEEIDLVITSPPYLNSRDYTDTYMVELRVLGYLTKKEDVTKLRKETIRSHVQIRWAEVEILEIEKLKYVINELNKHSNEFWNSSLPQMIAGYFYDINDLLKKLYTKMVVGGMIFFNVANSSYYNIEIEVDIIISQIAEKNGFKIREIREARRIHPSSQQKNNINYLRESVIVMIK